MAAEQLHVSLRFGCMGDSVSRVLPTWADSGADSVHLCEPDEVLHLQLAVACQAKDADAGHLSCCAGFGAVRSARESEASCFESAKALTRCNVPTTVRVCEILQESPNLPDLSTLDALVDVSQHALLFLLADTASR